MSNGKTDPLDMVIADWRKEVAAMRKIGSEGDAMHRMVHALLASDLESRCDRLAAIQGKREARAWLADQQSAVPNEMPSADLSRCCDIVYAEGWNACRAAMLADQPAKGGA